MNATAALNTGLARTRSSEWTLWIVALATAVHATEEYFTGWQQWASGTLGIVMPSSLFIIMNAVLVVIAFVLARGGWKLAPASLVIPAATLVNGILFHIVPTLLTDRAAPGVYSAVALYLPFSTWAIVGAHRDGVRTSSIMIGCILGTAVALAVVVLARSIS